MILTVSGSLRKRSSNRAMLQAYVRLLPPGWQTGEYDGLARLPHFNPDEDNESAPAEVVAWRDAIAAADAVVLSTPEYAHALPGAFKNSLDWLVSDPAFMGKRVVIIKANRGSDFATESLREVLRTMSAKIVEEACVGLSLSTHSIDAEQILARGDLLAALEISVNALNASFALP